MNVTGQPEYPLHVLDLLRGEQYTIANELSLCKRIEWYDSESPDDTSEIMILDAKYRRIRLKMEALSVNEFSLASDLPNDEDIAKFRGTPWV